MAVGILLLTIGGACRTTPHASRSSPMAPMSGSAGDVPVLAEPSPDLALKRPSEDASTDSAVKTTPAPAASEDGGSKLEEVSESLVDSENRTLPQTTDRPSAQSPSFDRRIRRLFDAIREDRPDLASSSFFPMIAYREVKAVAQPDRDWQHRLMRAFERDIHEYHKKLGRDGTRATLLGIGVHEERARWMKPGTEGNKLGYWRVLRSELSVRDPQGRTTTLEVTSLISWRGEWYVVHLNGFE